MDRRSATVQDEMHTFFLLDSSGSMASSMGCSPIQTLNEAMANLLPELSDAALRKEVTVYAHILTFNSSVTWLCGTSATVGIDVEKISWNDISASGSTDTAKAIREILPGLSRTILGHHAYRPIIVLITDGYSDNREETKKAIAELNKRQKCNCLAIGVEGYNACELNDFASTGTVVTRDLMGNVVKEEKDRRFIFTVQDSSMLSSVISSAAVSSLLNSKLEDQDNDRQDVPPIVDIPKKASAGAGTDSSSTDPDADWVV